MIKGKTNEAKQLLSRKVFTPEEIQHFVDVVNMNSDKNTMTEDQVRAFFAKMNDTEGQAQELYLEMKGKFDPFTTEEIRKALDASAARRLNQEAEPEAVPTAQGNLEENTEVFVPDEVEETIEEPVEQAPDVPFEMTETEIEPTSEDVIFGVDGPQASTEVDGQDNEVESIVPGNDIQSSVEEDVAGVAITGADGVEVIAEDYNEEPESDLYNFDSSAIVAIEVPVEEADDSEVIEMLEVQPGVLVLKNCYLNRNSKIRSIAVRKGKIASDYIKSHKFPKIHNRVRLQNRTFALPKSSNGFIFQHSNTLGLIAVEAPLVRGINNAKYNLFCSVKGHLVNSTGSELAHSTHNRVIASINSNRGIRASKYSRNLFAEVERAYTKYLVQRYRDLSKKSRETVLKQNALIRQLRQDAAKQNATSAKTISELKQQVLKSSTSLSNVRQSILQSRQAAKTTQMTEEEKAKIQSAKTAAKKKADALSRMMGSF